MKKLLIALLTITTLFGVGCGDSQQGTSDPQSNPQVEVIEHQEEEVQEGLEIYSSDICTLTIEGLKEDDIWGTQLVIEVVNNSDKDLCIQPDDKLSIGDNMVGCMGSVSVKPNKKAKLDIDFFEEDLEEVDSIDNIEGKLLIMVDETYDKLDEVEFTYSK